MTENSLIVAQPPLRVHRPEACATITGQKMSAITHKVILPGGFFNDLGLFFLEQSYIIFLVKHYF
jgi:hypothetical protein